MRAICLLVLAAGCAADSPTPEVVTGNLAFPADIQIIGDQLYSVQYDGSVIATSLTDHSVRTIVPAVRTVAANEITVDLGSYNIAVTGDAIYWTSNASGQAQVLRVGLDGTGAAVLDSSSLAPFYALIATPAGVCWAGELAIRCLHGDRPDTVALGVAEPRSMVTDGANLYFVQAASQDRAIGANIEGDGGVYALSLAGGPVRQLATGLNDVRALLLFGDELIWIDGGTETCSSSGTCLRDHDASVHTLQVAGPDVGVTLVESSEYASIDDGFVADAHRVYFVAEARLRSRRMDELSEDVLLSHSAVGCAGLAVADGLLYCAEDHAIVALGVERDN